MFKELIVHATFGERTGYQIHASRFFPRLDKLVRDAKGTSGTVHISLLDTVTASQIQEFPPSPSILYNVWESTEQPKAFMDKLKHYDQLWVPSEAQRSWSIAQGVPEEFVKVVPEGVDADIFKPAEQSNDHDGVFKFYYCGQWQPRKSTEEVCKAFIKAFPNNENVRLYLSADTLFPSDTYKSTEERLVAYGINDPRIIPVHYEEREEYIRRLQNADCFVSCARSEGWGLPICFPPKTKVITPQGNVSIDELKHGELVFSHTGESRHVLTTMKRKYGGDLISIMVYGDHEPIECTPEHPLFAIKRPGRKFKKSRFYDVHQQTPEWIAAKDISIGDLVIKAIPEAQFGETVYDLAKEFDGLKSDNNYVWYPTGFNGKGQQCKYNRYISLNDLSFLIGWYIAEGSGNSGDGIEFSLNAKEEETAKELLRQLKLYFNADGSYSVKDNRLRVRCSSRILSSFFTKICGDGAENKHIPVEVLYGDVIYLKEVVNEYVEGDGHKSNGIISITTISEMLARQLQVAALRLGLKPTINNYGKREGNFDQYVVTWHLKNNDGRHSNKSWWSKFGIASLVRKIDKKQYNGFVYNIEVEKDNSYLLQNASVHNCEAMACGIPVIVSDWGGSTEYHKGAITVPVKQLIKPFGIYGNWDVPGKWCEPDYDKLVEVMQDVYRNDYKESALKLSEKIRTEFSWDAAAQKGFNVLKELSEKCIQDGPVYEVHPDDPDKAPDITESDIRKYAASHGFKINGLQKEKSIFVVGTWPNSSEKMESLLETLQQIKQLGFPVLISTHYPLPAHIVELADYVLYEKKNVLSDDWRATYARRDANGHLQEKECRIPYHGVACLNAIRNAIDFCHPKFDRMFYIEYDSEVDVDIFVDKVRESSAPFVGVKYEGQGIHTDLWSGELSWLFNNIPVINSWDEYKAGIDERIFKNEYPLEIWLWNRLKNVQRQVAFVDIPITNRFDQVDRELWDDDIFRVHFFDGPYLFIDGLSRREYDVQYKVGDTVIYNVKQKVGMWSKPKIKYYLPWEVTASIDGVEKFRHTIDLKGKRVLIQMASKALGDSIAWIPYVEEFRKKHDCHVLCSGWWQEIFDYPEIEWVKPGSEVKDIYASYQIGCFDDQPDMNPKNWRETPLQKVAADILGLKYEPLRAKLKKFPSTQNGDVRDYICFSEFSTMKNKMWNRPGAWQKVVDKCRSLGYKCISVSAEPTQLNDVIKHNGQPIEKTIEDIRKCTFYIGLNHGPSWIAYALGIPCLMITGVSEEWNDFPNPYRIAINNKVCGVGCFNDPALPIDRGWLWCPRGKNYACTSEITEHMVYEKIHELSVIRRDGHAVKKGEKSGRDKFQHIRNDKGGTPESPSNSGVPEQCGEV